MIAETHFSLILGLIALSLYFMNTILDVMHEKYLIKPYNFTTTHFNKVFLFSRIILFIDHYEAPSNNQRTTSNTQEPRAAKSVGNTERHETQVILAASRAGTQPARRPVTGETQHC